MSGVVSDHKFKMQPIIKTSSQDSPFLPHTKLFDNEKSLSTGSIAIKLEGSSVVPTQVYNIIQKAISNMNTVLEQLVPGLTVTLENIGFLLLPNKGEGCTIELVSIRNGKTLTTP